LAAQGIHRREVLRMLSIAAAAATYPGFHKWVFAQAPASEALAQIRPVSYQPLFFTPAEYALLERLTEIIIPTDDSPGAREAGVSEFIDLMSSRDAELRHRFRVGLAWLNKQSLRRDGQPFLSLAPERQVALLEPLAYKAKHRAGEEQGREFFDLLREYTVMGFYTTEIGLKELDFPGFQFYADSPACPHKDDPEHRHLPPPKW